MNAPDESAPQVEPLDTQARIVLRGWLGDAGRLGIDPELPETLQDAYEKYLDQGLATEPESR